MAACCGACALLPPPADAACCAACAVGCICYHPETIIHLHDEDIRIDELKVGDYVKTLKNNVPTFTKVLQVQKVTGNFTFFHLRTAKGILSVTDLHPVFILDPKGDVRMSPASVIEVGTKLLLISGPQAVLDVTKSTGNWKFHVKTEDCTILASGVLTATDCDNDQFFQNQLK